MDSAVQQELEKALASAVEKHGRRAPSAWSCASTTGPSWRSPTRPATTTTEFGEASAEAQRDRVLTDPYEPGSTFKAFTVAAALEEGAVTPASTFVVPDHMAVADHVIHDSRPHATEVMAAGGRPQRVEQRRGDPGRPGPRRPEVCTSYIRGFGFGEATGVDLWGEDPGIVPAYEDWSGVSIGNIPIGQGLTVTPLQLVSGYAALVNGGRRVTPT